MRKLLFVAAAAAAVFVAVPANAQVYIGADPYGAGVQVGPLGVGVGDNWRYRRGWNDAYYGGECRTIGERIRTPSGNMVVRTQRVCD